MRKLALSLLAALVVMVPALAVVGPAQAAPTPASASAATTTQATPASTARKKHKTKKQKAKQRRQARSRAAMRTWNRLAHCESTSRWHIASGNGYYGGLQISPSTWRAFGGKRFAHLPHRATKKQQVAVGKRIQQGQGWGAWPSCSRKIGLR